MENWTPQRALQAEKFSSALASVSNVYRLPDNFAEQAKNGEFTDARMGVFEKPGLYITGEPLLTEGESLLEFRYMPDLEPGKTASVNQVCFGDITVVDKTGLLTPLTVAIKPRYSAPKLAVHEFGAYKHINDQKVIKTYEPLGFLVAPDDSGKLSTYLLTLFEPDIRTFDNFNWEITSGDVERGKPLAERARRRLANLGKAGLYLASMHASGLLHRDAQAKNVAVSTRDGATMLVDLETAQSLRGKDKMWEATEYDLGAGFAKDVITFVKSIQAIGFMKGCTTSELSRILKAHFFGIYDSRLRHPISEIHALSHRPLEPENIIQHVRKATLSELAKPLT